MLNPFPIQFLSLFGHTLLRVGIGGVLIYLGLRHLFVRHDMKHACSVPLLSGSVLVVWYLALFELLAGTMFILGFFTQYAALISMVMAFKMILFHRWFASPYVPGRLFYVVLFFSSLSLFITGAGFFAFDLPI